MSDVMSPEPTLPPPPRRDRWIVWTAMASVTLHAGVLVLLLWHPLPDSAEAAPPPAIDVELVPPPEPVKASEPLVEEPDEKAPVEEPGDGASESEDQASAVTKPPAETTPAESPPKATATEPSPPAERAAAPQTPPATQESAPETPSETGAPEASSAAATAAASEPAPGAESSAEAPPIPLSRPRVRGLSAPADAPDQGGSALTADSGEMAEGTAPPAPSEEPDAAILALGEERSAERFYLEAMLSAPSMAQARAMLETLPPEKRLAQTCNIEALAQIGNAGEGYSPDVVMAEAYARAEVAGTHLAAPGAIFRSGEKWYGFAFDCTLSDDLESVTAFSYRLGADVTDAVLARLGRN